MPVDEGQRLIVIRTRHVAGPEAGDVTRASAHDFVQWRGALKSVTDLGGVPRRELQPDRRATEARSSCEPPR